MPTVARSCSYSCPAVPDQAPALSPATARAAASGHTAGPAVFVNQLHDDNAGTDTGEAVELAGPAGTDLTGWTLAACNGATGTAYDTRLLGGTLADQQAGFGTLAVDYPTNGLQNGSPDGLALIDPAGLVVPFVCYEDTFTALGGPADRRTSEDMGVAEGSSTPVGHSLRLTGQGWSYEEMTWAAGRPACSTGRS